MMFMPDALRATVEVMEADAEKTESTSTRSTSLPSPLYAGRDAESIRRKLPGFVELTYAVKPNLQAIADGWPQVLDDLAAREEWGWGGVQPRRHDGRDARGSREAGLT